MPYVRITDRYSYGGQLCDNVFHFATPNIAPTATILADLAQQFVDVYIPAITGVQVTQVTHTIVTSYAPNVGFGVDVTANEQGQVASIPSGNIPPDIALLMRRSVGLTQRNDNGQIYAGNRPIRRGQFFLSGLPKNFMGQSGFELDTYATQWNTFFDTMLLPLEDSSNNFWYPVVLGEDLPATLTKDARPLSFAFITDVSPRQYSNLSTRDA